MPAARSALALLLWGLALDLVDLRLGRFDVVPDVVGLALVVLALRDLSELLPGLARARQVAVVAAVLSLADVVHPPSGSPTGPWGLGSGLHEVALALVLVLLCRAVARAARERSAATVSEVFDRLVLWNTVLLVVVALMTAVIALGGAEAADLGVLLWPVVVVGVALRLWTMARLWGLQEGPPLVQPQGAAAPVTGAPLPHP